MKIRRFYWFCILVLAPLMAFLPVTLGKHPLVYDIVTTALPWRHFIGECLRQHLLPLWNPYQHLGYPIHADPQSGAWYLPVWILGWCRGYDFFTLSFEFLGHIVLAGFGMRWLALRLKLSQVTAAMLGISYACSGFFVGNAQHLPFIISACWLPFILASLIRLAETRKTCNLIAPAVFLWLTVTGGYPGFTIILAYLILLLMGYYFFTLFRRKEFRKMGRLFLLLLAVGLLSLVLSLPYLVSFYQALPYITRGDGTSLAQALVCPFSPQSTLSFLFPLAVVAETGNFHTDVSMTNIYIGLVPLALFLWSLFRKDTALKWIFIGFSFFSLAAAFGSYLPVRAFLYQYFPLMDYFRMPAIFRVFVILGFLVAAGYSLDELIEEGSRKRKPVLRFLGGLSALLLIVLIFTVFRNDSSIGEVFRLYFLDPAQSPNIIDNLQINSLLLFVQFSFVFLLVLLYKKKLSWGILALTITFIDLTLSANLNAPYTAYSRQTTVQELNKQIREIPDGFPVPENHPVNCNRDAFKSYKDLWVNLNCFYKQIGYEGYNPFTLKRFENLVFGHPDVFQQVITHPPCFLVRQTTLNPEILSFTPDYWKIKVNSLTTDTLVVLQNQYPGWEITVNGNPVPSSLYIGTFLSAGISKGDNLVEFRYYPVLVLVVTAISVVVMDGLILYLLWRTLISLIKRWRRQQEQPPAG